MSKILALHGFRQEKCSQVTTLDSSSKKQINPITIHTKEMPDRVFSICGFAEEGVCHASQPTKTCENSALNSGKLLEFSGDLLKEQNDSASEVIMDLLNNNTIDSFECDLYQKCLNISLLFSLLKKYPSMLLQLTTENVKRAIGWGDFYCENVEGIKIRTTETERMKAIKIIEKFKTIFGHLKT